MTALFSALALPCGLISAPATVEFNRDIRPIFSDKCFTCHAVDKDKEAPSWTKLAAKLKNDKDAQAKLIKHLTTGPKVKFLDGHEEEHPIIKTKDQDQIKNLVDWILSL